MHHQQMAVICDTKPSSRPCKSKRENDRKSLVFGDSSKHFKLYSVSILFTWSKQYIFYRCICVNILKYAFYAYLICQNIDTYAEVEACVFLICQLMLTELNTFVLRMRLNFFFFCETFWGSCSMVLELSSGLRVLRLEQRQTGQADRQVTCINN